MRHRQISSGAGQLAALAGAAALMLALTFFAHGLLLGLSALVIGPLPAAKTALSLSRKQAAASSQPAASADAIEPDAPAQAQPDAAAPADTSYFVALEGDDARPADAGIILEKNYPQGSGEKYIPCGTGTIKNNTRVPAAEVAAEIEGPLPFSVEWNSPEPQILIMHTHATEDYRLSAGLWFRSGDGSRTTDRSYNMCAVGRVMADTLNAAGLNTLHDEALNDYPSYTGSYANSRAVVQQYLSPVPQHQDRAGRPPRRHRDGERLPDGPGLHRQRPTGRAGHDHLRVRQRRQRLSAELPPEPPLRRRVGAGHGKRVPRLHPPGAVQLPLL